MKKLFPFSVLIIFVLACGLSPTKTNKYEDNFSSSRSGWPTGTYEGGTEWGYIDEQYRILIQVKTGQVLAGQIAYIPLESLWKPSSSLIVEADTIQLTGSPVTLYGVMCGTSSNDFYFFLINPDGHYVIFHEAEQSGTASLLQSGKSTVPINGIAITNRIKGECISSNQESTFTLTVNGQKVAETQVQQSMTFASAGFMATTLYAVANSTQGEVSGVSNDQTGSPTTFEADIRFDNFEVSIP